MDKIEKKDINNAIKWSALTELLAKLISPITSMILARLLTPESFGIVASVTMVTSFSDMFTDFGCNKYIIQHTFKDDLELSKYSSVGFWTNLIISSIIWMIIYLFRNRISSLVGIPGMGNTVIIASLSLLFTSFSSIQMAIMRKNLNFKKLFKIRFIITSSVLVVSVIFVFLGL